MSLTDHLGPEDPIRKFLDALLPNYDKLKEQWRELGPIKFLPEYEVSWSLVGMALDYRIRLFFDAYDATTIVAAGGWWPDQKLRGTFEMLAKDLRTLCGTHSPVGRILPSPHEESLLRYCYVLALYETNARTSLRDSPLRTLKKGAGSRAQLNRVPEDDLADLKVLTDAAYEAFRPLLGSPYHLNPTFADSSLVDGADADLIVGNNLIEIKAERDRFQSKRIRQVVIYALLAYSDGSCTPVPMEVVHRFRRSCTPRKVVTLALA
jgi:hypothetical protein